MNEHVSHSLAAAVAGVALGSPLVGRSGFTRLNGFSPIPHRMTPDTAFDAWLLWAAHARSESPPEALGMAFLDGLDENTAETAYGLMNLRRGFGPPLSGSFQNPLAGGSRSLLRSAVWGWLYGGDPELAARHAYFDSSVDHCGDGVCIPVAFAFALASCPPGTGWDPFWNAFTSVLPDQSLLNRAAPLLLDYVGHPEAVQNYCTRFGERFPHLANDSALASATFVLSGLRHGGTAERAMLLAAGCGGASGISGGLAAAVGSWIYGPLPAEYTEVFDGQYLATHALRGTTPPKTLTEFIHSVASCCREWDWVAESPAAELATTQEEAVGEMVPAPNVAVSEVDAPSIVPDELNPTESQAIPDTTTAAPDLPAPKDPSIPILRLLTLPPNYYSTEVSEIRVTTSYLSPPVGAPPNRELALEFKNLGSETCNLELKLTCPDGWKSASALTGAKLTPGSSVRFPAVVQPAPTQDSNLRLGVGDLSVLLPFAMPQRYWALGPFTNIEGTGFSQEYPPERTTLKEQVWDQAFSGRSNLGIRWQVYEGGGTEFDIEPLFADGPGVAFLYAKLVWPTGGTFTIQAGFAGGLKVWVDNNALLSYHDSEPRQASHPQNVAQFQSGGESRILIKLVRGRDPVLPLSLTFFDDGGRIILPRTDATP